MQNTRIFNPRFGLLSAASYDPAVLPTYKRRADFCVFTVGPQPTILGIIENPQELHHRNRRLPQLLFSLFRRTEQPLNYQHGQQEAISGADCWRAGLPG